MKATDRDALKRTRAQALLVKQLRERIGGESRCGLRAIRMDGMPGGSRSTAGLDARMIRLEEMTRVLRREEARLRRLEKAAREVILNLRPELYAFCTLYYIAGMSVDSVSEAIDRSERQCLRYKREIEAEEAGAEPGSGDGGR